MPRKNYAKKKKTYRKKKKQGARAVTQVGRQITTRRNFCKLTYEIGQVGTTTTTTLGNFQLRMNSCFDPQYAVGGGQPRGYDQWTAFYANYRVHGCKIEVHAQSLTANNQSILALSPRTVSTVPPSVKSLMEQPGTRRCFFTSDRACTLKAYFSMPKVLGVTNAQYNSDDYYWAGTGSDPGQLCLCNIDWININESTSTGHNIRANVTYYVEFFKPLYLSAS